MIQEVHHELIRESVAIDKQIGRDVTKLPFLRDPAGKLNDNAKLAAKILNNVCRKYASDEEVLTMVNAAFKTLITTGQIVFFDDVPTALRDEIRKAKPSYYIPWDIGKIEAVKVGRDGYVREATIAYKNVVSDDPEDWSHRTVDTCLMDDIKEVHDVAKKVLKEEVISNDKNDVTIVDQENILPSTPSVTDLVPNVKEVKKKRRSELENLKIGDDWNFNLSVTAHLYSSPQFDSSSTVSVAANAMVRAVQVQMGADSQATEE